MFTKQEVKRSKNNVINGVLSNEKFNETRVYLNSPNNTLNITLTKKNSKRRRKKINISVFINAFCL